MGVTLIKEMLGNGADVIDISVKLGHSRNYIRFIKTCANNGVSPSFYKNRFFSLNPGRRNEIRKENYRRGGIYDDNSRKPYDDEDRELILKFPGTDRELAKLIRRTVEGIQIERYKLRKQNNFIKT